MSHFAELNESNEVVRVVVCDNNDPNGDEGYAWLNDNFPSKWIKTSYNAKIRGKFAGIGDTYNEDEDLFIEPQPFPSWIRNGSFWNAPIKKPESVTPYIWDEELGNWVEAEIV